MADADDTRLAQKRANKPQTTPTHGKVLEALLARLAAAKAEPTPSKSARPPSIKPRRQVTVTPPLPGQTDAATPWIRLCGHWLTHAGFPMATRVRVHVAKGCLILIPETAES